jgi:Zn ribbon nucleic-acid-binding protein
MENILVLADHNECVICGHEWKNQATEESSALKAIYVKKVQ